MINGGSGSSSFGIAAGTSDPTVTVYKNSINGGPATSGPSWAIDVSSAMIIDSNAINATGTPSSPAGATSTVWSGGIRSWSSNTIITNNVILGAAAALSAGVSLNEAEQPAGAVVLNGNDIFGGASNVALSVSTAIRLAGPCGGTGCGNNAFVGKIRNNILVPGTATARFGVYEDPVINVTTPKTEHPVALENNQFYVANPGVADALYRFHDGTNGSLLTLAQVNALTATVAGTAASNNQEGDPSLDSKLHLNSGSPCIDKGTATEAPPKDFEGDTRPQGNAVDIGADESN
jgi:hypothetical protein